MESIGLKIIEEIAFQDMIDAEEVEADGEPVTLFTWAGNAPEQLEALCYEFFRDHPNPQLITHYWN